VEFNFNGWGDLSAPQQHIKAEFLAHHPGVWSRDAAAVNAMESQGYQERITVTAKYRTEYVTPSPDGIPYLHYTTIRAKRTVLVFEIRGRVYGLLGNCHDQPFLGYLITLPKPKPTPTVSCQKCNSGPQLELVGYRVTYYYVATGAYHACQAGGRVGNGPCSQGIPCLHAQHGGKNCTCGSHAKTGKAGHPRHRRQDYNKQKRAKKPCNCTCCHKK
jgi:hypothetical protein